MEVVSNYGVSGFVPCDTLAILLKTLRQRQLCSFNILDCLGGIKSDSKIPVIISAEVNEMYSESLEMFDITVFAMLGA